MVPVTNQQAVALGALAQRYPDEDFALEWSHRTDRFLATSTRGLSFEIDDDGEVTELVEVPA